MRKPLKLKLNFNLIQNIIFCRGAAKGGGSPPQDGAAEGRGSLPQDGAAAERAGRSPKISRTET